MTLQKLYQLNSDCKICEDLPKLKEHCYSGTTDFCFNDLPKEILFKIFSYLMPQELCRHVANVCTKWHKMAHDPLLWQVLALSAPKICPEIGNAPFLRSLKLVGWSDLNLIEEAMILNHFLFIRKLNLGFSNRLEVNLLKCFLDNCKNLISLNVEGCDKDVSRDHIELLCNYPYLTHLNFSHCYILRDEELMKLILSLNMIMDINIYGIPSITDQTVCCLADHHKETILYLELDGEELTDDSAEAIAQMKHLKKLCVYFCQLLTDISLVFIQELRFLTELKLQKGHEFSSEGVQELFTTGNLAQLQLLNLTDCTNLTDECLQKITKCCGSSLRHLSISWCWNITDKGFTSIIDNCRNMRTLSAAGLHSFVGNCLIQVPEKTRYLSFLDLTNCHLIQDDMIIDLVRKKPDIRVLNYYAEEFVHS